MLTTPPYHWLSPPPKDAHASPDEAFGGTQNRRPVAHHGVSRAASDAASHAASHAAHLVDPHTRRARLRPSRGVAFFFFHPLLFPRLLLLPPHLPSRCLLPSAARAAAALAL